MHWLWHPQSFPIPHEHDRTDRENTIIKHFEDISKELKELIREAGTYITSNVLPKCLCGKPNASRTKILEKLIRAL